VGVSFPERGLYAITPQSPSDTALLCAVEEALQGGAVVIQFRDKSRPPQTRLQLARALRDICHRYQAPLIINDDIQLAQASCADGVHLGRDDGSIEQARALLGPEAMIGVSCYGELARAQNAQSEGASYVAFGRFFPSTTKPKAKLADRAILQQARKQISLPIVAIGGITADNGAPLIEAGADLLACVESVFGGSDIEQNTRAFEKLFI